MRIQIAFVALALLLILDGRAHAADIYNNTNTGGVANQPTGQTAFALRATAHVHQLVTYHWNNGRGAAPGTIALRGPNNATYGPFRAHGTSGQGNAANVNWIADVDITLPPGTYVVVDSDPATWAHNPQSGNQGFAVVRGDYVSAGGPGAPAAPGAPRVAVPQPPNAVPQPAPRVAATPPSASQLKPCHRTTNAVMELVDPPCSGPVGTIITLHVLQPLQKRLTAVVFRHGPIGAQQGARAVPSNIAVTAQASTGALRLVGGNGSSPGSLYQITIDSGLCRYVGLGQWTYDVWLEWADGTIQGDVDDFTVVCR